MHEPPHLALKREDHFGTDPVRALIAIAYQRSTGGSQREKSELQASVGIFLAI
jgi:hypothetical protein